MIFYIRKLVLNSEYVLSALIKKVECQNMAGRAVSVVFILLETDETSSWSLGFQTNEIWASLAGIWGWGAPSLLFNISLVSSHQNEFKIYWG